MMNIKFRLIKDNKIVGYEVWVDDMTGKYWGYYGDPRTAIGAVGMNQSPIVCDTKNQFTGLRDKHNNEIYEGDILRHIIETPQGFRLALGAMIYNERMAQFGVMMEIDDNDPIGESFSVKESVSGRPEIIGNLYETPELLPVRNK